MVISIGIAETEVMLDARYDWENQLKDLKETFKEFYLLRYEYKELNGCRYNCFKFTHEVEINCNYN